MRAGVRSATCSSDEPAEAVAVKLGKVRVERSRSFGAVWLGWMLWQALKLDELCEELLPRGREAVAWAEVIAILVIGRLCEPSSELHVAEHWYRTTALEDLLGVATEQIYDERLYRALDRVLPHKEAIETHLVERLGELFDLDYDLLLYDVTSTYFEGVADPAIARRGYSRDHRPDCVQVNIALVVTREGMPLGYEIFRGDTVDVTTVEEIVEAMERRFGKARRVWVMDRGMVSAENIAWLNATGRRYVLGTARSELQRWRAQLAERRRLAPDPRGRAGQALSRPRWGRDVPVVPLGEPHREGARDARALRQPHRSRARLARPTHRAQSRGDWIAAALERQIGRLLERNARAAARYAISIEEDPSRASGVRLTGAQTPSGTNGRRSAKAPTSCAPTCMTGPTRSCGRPTSSSPRPKRPSASTSPTSPCARSGTTRRHASRPISWSASSPTRCGRRCSSGSRAPAWASPRARSSPSSRASRPPTSCCRWPTARSASCACAAWCAPIPVRRCSCSGSGSTSRSDCACHKPPKCSGDFGP